MKDYSNSQKIAKASSALILTLMLISLAAPVKAAERLSPGVDVIASEFSMAANGVIGTDIYIGYEDFKDSLGVEELKHITVASLPDATLGRLMIGNRYAAVGDTLNKSELDDLRFVPFGSDEIAAVFGFVNGKGTDGTVYKCTVYTTRSVNAAPVVTVADSLPTSGGELSAYSGVTCLGTVSAEDPEGDSITFEIVSKPIGGEVRLTDKQNGYFEYTASRDFSGKDSFKVVAVDKYGNRSEAGKITLRVSKPKTDEIFADMDGHFANSAVISLVKAGILESPENGECFYPNEPVSRAEFLSLAMKTAGYTGFSVTDTGFSDDSDIPSKYKGCIAAADAFGIISGIETADGVRFYPNNQITKAEAAVIISRLTGISDIITPVFSDSSVPAWAASAVSGLNRAGILRGTPTDGLDCYSVVTRGAAAQMLSAVVGR